MKLYTEEQVKMMLDKMSLVTERKNLGVSSNFRHRAIEIDNLIKLQTPIELPSDEEVEQYLKSFPYTKHLDDGQYNDGVIVGAELAIEWMRDKIQEGNNG